MFDPHSRADGSEPSTIESIKSIPSIKEELSSELEEHDANGKAADVKQEPLSPIVDQQTLMMRTIIENNESNHDDSGSYFKFVVSFFHIETEHETRISRFARRKPTMLY